MSIAMTPLLFLVFCVFQASSGSVIIVGAGSAGIAAATKLLQNNFTDIIILEAEGRIGGRVHSIKFGETFIDLGAEWCNGEKGNVIYDLVKDLHVLDHTSLDNLRFQYSTGGKVDEGLNDQLWQIILQTYILHGERGQNEGVTLGDYCGKKYNSSVLDLQLEDSKKLNFANDVLTFFETFVAAMTQTFSWSSPSAQCDYRLSAGEPFLNWKAFGFKTVLDVMMKKFPSTGVPLPIDDKILFNKEVSQILWDQNASDGVTVKCTDGSEYNADHVIFTPSLGVLKEKHGTMFQPELPDYKKVAIKALGIDGVVKVTLYFRDDWWRQEEFSGFNMVWSSEDISSKLITERNMTWVYDILGFYPPSNSSNVLSAWFAGPHVPQIEQLSDKDLLEGINFILDKFLGSFYNITEPDDFIRTWWYTNPHFRGTASFQTVASRKNKSNKDLSQPLTNSKGDLTLLFAGEATHEWFYSTVHGAIETGYREAERLLKWSRKKKFLIVNDGEKLKNHSVPSAVEEVQENNLQVWKSMQMR